MAEKTMKNRRVLLFPFPFQGHINPMLELAAVLRSRSFSVTIFHTEYNYEAIHPSKYPSYRFITIPDRVSKLTSSSQDHVLSLICALNDNCTTPFRESLAQVLSEGDWKSSVPCLVLDMHWYKINPIAKLLGVPTLVLRTGSAASLNGFITLPALYRKGILPSKAEWELELAVEELPPMRVRDMIAVGNDPEQLLNFVVLDAENARTSLGIIINTSQAMEGAELDKLQRDLALPAFAVGPLHKHDMINLEAATTNTSPSSCTLKLLDRERDQDRLCMEWLDSHPPKSVLYVSFGSLASMDPKDFTEMAWGLADSSQPFLWVVRSGSVESVLRVELALPDGFRNATHGIGKIVEWAPQRDILAHRAIGGFWTHCGWNSTVESIAEGIPMICTPFFSDQMGNTRYVSDVWKVGLELRTPLERGKVERSVRRLMTTEDGEEMRARARDLQGMLSECIQKEGCSYKAVDDLVGLLLSLSPSLSE
ncbi:DIMBOA UDP-glucosyltransferase BX9-like protein [Carex littledalei]|uniref:2,4-dihydroxy-7-methoxy-2H-1,4-benzoxazin-3(4H)-one 2-D-glucosyltransferase n=1 Tax=Carex littledalei TaxID=544730 RepID=A0A833R7I3_9POAL|nr:DIMBOA UDP-glucosyltransferase BX9-like protein [Carex littledalei]